MQEVTRINPQMEMRRETIRSGVFKPGHRLPTMTLEEYADRELADAQERQKREQYAVFAFSLTSGRIDFNGVSCNLPL